MTIYRDVPLSTLPQNHYRTIYADCPWGFLTRDKRTALPQRTRFIHYKPMTMPELLSLPVASVAAKDCVLHMWTISSHVHLTYEVAAAWGFEPKSLGIVWVKTQKGDPEKPKMGMGFWFRQECEIALVFTRGKPPRDGMGVRQIIMEPAREHSRKPDVAVERVEQLSQGPYLEMFSRTDRPGWDVWGDEAGNFALNRAERMAKIWKENMALLGFETPIDEAMELI